LTSNSKPTHHFEALVREHQSRGLTSEAAHTKARRDMGGLTQVKEAYREQRGLPVINAIWQDVRYTIRILRRSRVCDGRHPHTRAWHRWQHGGLQRR